MRQPINETLTSRLDHLKASMIGRRVQRNGSAEVATVVGVYPAADNSFAYRLADDRLVSAEEWTVIR